MSDVAVVGAGAWGSALAIQAHRAGCKVRLVARDAAKAAALAASRTSPQLKTVRLPEAIEVADTLGPSADLIVWAVPMQRLRESLHQFRPASIPLVLCMKGVEAETGWLPTEVTTDVLGPGSCAILSGPNFAEEIAHGLPAASVVGAEDADLRTAVASRLGSAMFRIYGNADPLGVQLGGAAKNVMAIAAGVVIGAGLGENARAALVTRGLAELRRLIIGLGGHADTAMGLSGLGDLMLTCTGPASRNFTLGLRLGRGESLADIQRAVQLTVEGVATAKALVARAGGLELPICRAVVALLEGTKSLEQVVSSLLSRPQRDE